MTITVSDIHRYPIKGLSHEPLEAIALRAGDAVPGDRRYAIAHGASRFDAADPQWHSKRQFLMLMTNERLAALDTRLDHATGQLTIQRDGRRVAGGDLNSQIGRDLISQFLSAYLGREALGTPKIVEAPGISFTDKRDPLISIINRATVRDVERVVRKPVDALRFRGNLLIAGADPWAEFGWIGKTVRIGEAVVRIVERIDRCAATNVDPTSGARDRNIPRALEEGFGHQDCGVYAQVLEAGTVRRGDPVAVLDQARA